MNHPHPFERSISPEHCAVCGNGPGHSLHLGDLFEVPDEERQNRRAAAQREEMEARLRSVRGDISARSGEIERNSPLFFGTGDNPGLF